MDKKIVLLLLLFGLNQVFAFDRVKAINKYWTTGKVMSPTVIILIALGVVALVAWIV